MLNKHAKLIPLFAVVAVIATSACKKETYKEEATNFLARLKSKDAEVTQSQAYSIFTAFTQKNPVINELFWVKPDTDTVANPRLVSEYYGTWTWEDTAWVKTDSTNPANAILFTWNFPNTAHQAKILFTNIRTQNLGSDVLFSQFDLKIIYNTDTLTTLVVRNITYAENGNIASATISFTLGNNNIRYTLRDAGWVYNATKDNFKLISGSYSLTLIDTLTYYRMDMRANLTANDKNTFTVTDNEGGKIIASTSAPYTVGSYSKRNFQGTIWEDDVYVADLLGTVWFPEDQGHTSEISIKYKDDTTEPLQRYSEILFKLMK